MFEILALTFLTTVYTGPACDGIRARIRYWRDFPKARVAPTISSLSDSRLRYRPPVLRQRSRNCYNF